MVEAHRVHYTREEYIGLERSSNVKHEYFDGVIYAMAGGSQRVLEIVRRGEDGAWTRHEARAGEVTTLISIGCELSVDEVYRDPLAPA